MFISEPTRFHNTIHVPPWDPLEDHVTGFSSPVFATANANGVDSIDDSFPAIHRFLPCNEFPAPDFDAVSDDLDGFSCDHFRMFEFKVRRCARGRSHDWTECPFAHPGEKARRRDPRKYHYSGSACPEFRKGSCKKGDSCELAHGIFECWLHPARYRTQPCKDGLGCRRRVCFFAHSPEQLRFLPQKSPPTPVSGDCAFDSFFAKGSLVTSPTSILSSQHISSPSDSPPASPNCPQLGGGSFNSVSGLVASVQSLQLGMRKMSPQSRFPRGSGLYSLTSTPTAGNPLSGPGKYEIRGENYEEEPAMERVESGRDLRAKMYAKLGEDNSVGQLDSAEWTPDVGWVSDLLR